MTDGVEIAATRLTGIKKTTCGAVTGALPRSRDGCICKHVEVFTFTSLDSLFLVVADMVMVCHI